MSPSAETIDWVAIGVRLDTAPGTGNPLQMIPDHAYAGPFARQGIRPQRAAIAWRTDAGKRQISPDFQKLPAKLRVIARPKPLHPPPSAAAMASSAASA